MRLASQLWLALPAASWLLAGCGGDSEQEAAHDAGGGVGGRSDAAGEGKPTGSRQMAEAESQTGTEAAASEETAQAGSSAPAESASPAEDALVTGIPAMAGLVETVSYQHETPKPNQRCANCELYTRKTDERGSCKLFAQGLVESQGWCTSWVKKASTG